MVGDIRAEVKRILVRRRLANWSRQPHQGRIAREVGPSILTYCAEIRRMAWKLRSPGMQMFLLGSLCQVLPTRSRTNRGKEVDARTCIWCSDGAIDDSRHVFECRARGNGARIRWLEVSTLLKSLPPDVAKRPVLRPRRHSNYARWISRSLPNNSLDYQVCLKLVEGFGRVHGDGPLTEFNHAVLAALKDAECSCPSLHNCVLGDSYTTDFGLQELVREAWSLDTELFADGLHRNNRFAKWASRRAADVAFGGMGDAFDQSWKGMLAYAFPPGDLASSLSTLTKAGEDVETSLPTRFLILLPATDAIMQKVESMPHARKVMSFAAGSLPLGDPSAYRWPYSQMEMFRCGDAMVLVQVENAEAAAMYPVDGKQLADRLSRWENRWRMDKCLNIGWHALLIGSRSLRAADAAPSEPEGKIGALNWFDYSRAPCNSALLKPLEHEDAWTQGRLASIAVFDSYAGGLGHPQAYQGSDP